MCGIRLKPTLQKHIHHLACSHASFKGWAAGQHASVTVGFDLVSVPSTQVTSRASLFKLFGTDHVRLTVIITLQELAVYISVPKHFLRISLR